MKHISTSLRVLIAATTLLAYPSMAAAASAGFSVGLSVPVACFVVPPNPLTVNAGETATGSVMEACNKAGGYTVRASYRELAQDEAAVLQYNGETFNLPAGGEVIVHVSNVATVKQV